MTIGSKWLLGLIGAIALGPLAARSEPPPPLRVGVLPTLSTRVLFNTYEPLRGYLERELQRPVVMRTATDFRAFHTQTVAGDFDLVVTAPHLARLAQRERRWAALATYRTPAHAILLATKEHPVRSVEELRGKTIAHPDRLALVVIQTVAWLQERGLREGQDYMLLSVSSFNSAAYAVQQQQAALAIMSPSSMRQLPEQLMRDTQVFQTLPAVQALVWIAHPRLDSDTTRVRQALLQFTTEQPAGQEFFKVSGYGGMEAISDQQMRALDPYADQVKALLEYKK